MQFLFCYYEVMFFNFITLVKLDMKIDFSGTYFDALEKLIMKMRIFQDCFNVFLLLDISFMTIFWILHLFQIYLMFHLQSSISALGSFLIVLAELWRVLTITTECHAYEDTVKKLIDNINEAKLYVSEKDKMVSWNSKKLNKSCHFTEM